MADEPDESHGARVEYLAATAAVSIMLEHPMNGPTTTVSGFGATLNSPHKTTPITVTVAMHDRKTSWRRLRRTETLWHENSKSRPA